MVNATEICFVALESSKNFRFREQEELLKFSLYNKLKNRNLKIIVIFKFYNCNENFTLYF